jgi:aldose 1-epimerase
VTISRENFGAVGGHEVHRYTLTNRAGLTARFISYGATLTELQTPDRQGRMGDIVLGFDRLEGYLATDTYFGATCGRYGNRITKGRFALDGKTYQLSLNEPPNHLHGGIKGYDKVVWNGAVEGDGKTLTFTHRSPDGDEGYPGSLDIRASFQLTDANELLIDMTARTDKPTLANLVHHSYFNLGGHGSGNVLKQELKVHSDFYTPIDSELMTTGEILSVKGTPYDFTAFKAIGRDIGRIENFGGGRVSEAGGGYDHNLVLAGVPGQMRLAVEARDPASGRAFDLETTEPGVQFYTGGYLSEAVIGKGNTKYCKYGGFTLETQKYPDSPNFPFFPQARLDPGQTYHHRMKFRFHTV